jgi:hypothetical protein
VTKALKGFSIFYKITNFILTKALILHTIYSNKSSLNFYQ